MTIQRTNPVPPGRYWIDLVGPQKIGNFGAGVRGLNEAHPGIIRIISATRHLANEAKDYAESPDLTGVLVQLWEGMVGQIQDTPERDWVLFQVTAPAMWEFDTMGTPTVAAANVTSEADTAQRPDPEPDITEQILAVTHGGIGGTISKVVLGSVAIVTLGAVSYLVISRVIARRSA